MVKFSKELEAQLIPEWKEAFVNYWQLKKQIKKIKVSMAPKETSRSDKERDFGRSIFDPIRFAVKRIVSGENFFDADNNQTELLQVIY